MTQSHQTIIIGAGVAGLVTALKLAPMPVTVITARPLGRGGASAWAQGGIAAAIGPDDHPDLHFADTIKAGAGLVDAHAARILVEAGPRAVTDLVDWGVRFDRHRDGRLKAGREAAHSRARIVHATGDRAGAAIMEALITAARASDHITIFEGIVVEDLLTDDQGDVAGVLAYDIKAKTRVRIVSTRTVLATGGLGGLYAVTTNPVRAQGHGLAFAARAGAIIRDPEFVQFHPTALDVDIDPAPLATEAIRGAGAWLVNRQGHRFMADLHADSDLAPRDIVARAVEAEITAGRGACLDARTAIGAEFETMFPTVYAACQAAQINPATDLIPVAPACHYHMGGVQTDPDGRSSLNGLWAVGEVASSGIHGANRLASNSLLEAVVFGTRTAANIQSTPLQTTRGTPIKKGVHAPEDRLALPSKPADPVIMARIRKVMSREVALLRTGTGLNAARDELAAIEDKAITDTAMTSGLKSALITAGMIVLGAIMREESRGGHYRTDFPRAAPEPEHTEILYIMDDQN